jgi:hypothetical protein
MDVLLANFDSAVDISEGVVDEVEGTDLTDGPVAVNQRRWKRVAWAGGVLVKHVDGMRMDEGVVVIEGMLAQRIKEVEEAERIKVEEEERRKAKVQKLRDEEEVEEYGESESEDDDPELAALRVSRSHVFDRVSLLTGHRNIAGVFEHCSTLRLRSPNRPRRGDRQRRTSASYPATRCWCSTRMSFSLRWRRSQRSSRGGNGASSFPYLS